MAEPDYLQQGTDLPKGSASELEEGLDFAAAAPTAPAFDVGAVDESEIPEFVGDVPAGEVDEEIFGPTDFPNRPLTHGVPIGPGQDFTVTPRTSDRAILARAATRMLEFKDDLPAEALIFATRVLAGE